MKPLIESIQSRGATAKTSTQGMYDALAKSQEPIAGTISDTYRVAAADTGAFAAGYSDTMKALLGDSAAEANALLQQNNSPQQVQSGAGAADVLYGTHGAIPGRGLVREGAAFTSAAQMLPAQARTLGAQAVAGLDRETQEEIAKLEASKPGLIQQALSELNDARLKQEIAEHQGWVDRTRLQQGQERINLAWEGLEFRNQQAMDDAQEATDKGARPNASLSKVYGYVVDSNGVPILGPNGKRIPVKKTSKDKDDLSNPQKSVIVQRASKAGRGALDKLLDRLWSNVDADPEYEDDEDAKAEYENRKRLNWGTAMRVVTQAIGPHLKALGYTPAQVRAEARKIVSQSIAAPAGK